MNVLRSLRKLVLGETWVIPVSVLVVVAGGALVRAISPGAWHAAGPVLLPLGVVVGLALGVWRSLPRRRKG